MYGLMFPFTLPVGREIAVEPDGTKADKLVFSLHKRNDWLYVLNVDGFHTKADAERFLSNLWTGVMWLLLRQDLPTEATFELGHVAVPDDPEEAAKNLKLNEPVYGLADGTSPATYRVGKRLAYLTANPVTVLRTYAADNVLNSLIEGSSFPRSDVIMGDARLRVALELYSAHFMEVSANTRFLTLVMALEALAEGESRTKLVLRLQDEWLDHVRKLLEEAEPADIASLKTLENDLRSRRENSLTDQFRKTVFNTLSANGDSDAAEMARTAGKLYSHRGTLVHDGKLPSDVLSKAIPDAAAIVKRVLTALYLQSVGQDAHC